MKRMLQVVARWSVLVFGDHAPSITPRVRMLRLVEEVLELAQSEDVTLEEVGVVAAQVYGRPKGSPVAELGGTMVTLAAYCATRGYDPEDAFWREFCRIMDPSMMERVRRRNLEGDKIGLRSPNPERMDGETIEAYHTRIGLRR